MADQHSLMKPLRSDSLRPRASTQAVWPLEAAAPVPSEKAETVLEPSVQPLPETQPEQEPVVPPEPQQVIQPEEHYADLLLGEDGQPDLDDDAEYAGADAIPSNAMPEPVFVPLYDDVPPGKKRRGWLWLVLLMLIAGAGYAAWHFGLLDSFVSAILP